MFKLRLNHMYIIYLPSSKVTGHPRTQQDFWDMISVLDQLGGVPWKKKLCIYCLSINIKAELKIDVNFQILYTDVIQTMIVLPL